MGRFLPECNKVNTLSEKRWGVILCNLGSPKAPTASEVRPYLRQFLSDHRVVELPKFLWRPILYLFVLTFRPKQSAKKYKSIWLPEGSPLIHYSQKQANLVQQALAPYDIPVECAMTYGEPSVLSAWQKLQKQGVDRIVFLPVFPQYASSAGGASLDALWRVLLKVRNVPHVHSVRDFCDDEGYIQAVTQSIRKANLTFSPTHKLLFSFHGIPEAVHQAGELYVAQCHETARLVAQELDIDQNCYTVCFQSVFGKAKWVDPNTQYLLENLPKQGVKSITVCCPSFVCDCLESLEEMDIEGREIFQQAGGEHYHRIPCLNDDPLWIEALTKIIKKQITM